MASPTLPVTVDMRTICKELVRVTYKWFKIGTQLGVPHHKLKEFQKEDDPRALASTCHYVISNGTTRGDPLTWESVVKALDSNHVGEHGLAMSLRKKFCNVDDESCTGTLDLSIICEVVATVAHKWFEIGTQLGVPHHKLKEYEREDDPLSSTFHYLLSNGTVGGAPLTWRHLVEALESDHIGENDLAMFITNKHCTKTGIQQSIESATLRQKVLVTKETQTALPLPSKLQVHIPVHCATLKATGSFDRIPDGKDERLILDVSILDAATQVPLKCVVALRDDTVPSQEQMVCFLSLSVDFVGDNQTVSKCGLKQEIECTELYNIWRSKKSAYTANGQAKFYMCFYKTDANYIVTLNIDSVLDEEGIQCLGYTVEHYTGFVSTFKTVERSAFKAPPLLKFEGEIAKPKFNKLMSIYSKEFYEGRAATSSMIMSMMTSSDCTATLDVRLYMSVSKATEKSLTPQTITELDSILKQCRSMDSRNGFLIEALIMMALSQVHSLQGGREKALQCIHHSRSICLEAAPSHLTSCVFFNDARSMIGVNKDAMTPEIKRRILELFDRAIADSYYGNGWERIMIFNGHVNKALFCLNGTINICPPSESSYIPTKEDISMAEQHLKAAPIDVVNEIHRHMAIFDIAMSDLHRWKGNKSEARQCIKKARSLCTEKGYSLHMIPAMDDRLKLLKPDTIDEILEMFEN